jgi:hypothetical protein
MISFDPIQRYITPVGTERKLFYIYFPSSHRNSGTFPVESLAHDSGRTLVRAEYGYPKGPPNTNS